MLVFLSANGIIVFLSRLTNKSFKKNLSLLFSFHSKSLCVTYNREKETSGASKIYQIMHGRELELNSFPFSLGERFHPFTGLSWTPFPLLVFSLATKPFSSWWFHFSRSRHCGHIVWFIKYRGSRQGRGFDHQNNWRLVKSQKVPRLSALVFAVQSRSSKDRNRLGSTDRASQLAYG